MYKKLCGTAVALIVALAAAVAASAAAPAPPLTCPRVLHSPMSSACASRKRSSAVSS